jgi:hypothetical protein
VICASLCRLLSLIVSSPLGSAAVARSRIPHLLARMIFDDLDLLSSQKSRILRGATSLPLPYPDYFVFLVQALEAGAADQSSEEGTLGAYSSWASYATTNVVPYATLDGTTPPATTPALSPTMESDSDDAASPQFRLAQSLDFRHASAPSPSPRSGMSIDQRGSILLRSVVQDFVHHNLTTIDSNAPTLNVCLGYTPTNTATIYACAVSSAT